MLQRCFLGLTALLLCSVLHAQKATLNGYVRDGKTGERLLGASIFINNKNLGTTSNAFGFYSITLPVDTVDVIFSYAGYTAVTRQLALFSDHTLNIDLEPSSCLSTVVVKASRKESIQNRTQMSTIDLPVATIKALPAFLGEPDVMKAIQLLPGVQAGSEGSSGIYVRGGGPDQNLILLDGCLCTTCRTSSASSAYSTPMPCRAWK